MNLSEADAYALRRAVSMMEVPTALKVSPIVEALLKTLDWKHNPVHWSLLQQIATHDTAISTQILRIDPTADFKSTEEVPEEAFVPPLPKSAQLSDKLLAAAENV